MIPRQLEARLTLAATRYPAIAIAGPRQSGKTTLARGAFPRHPYVSLKEPDARRLALTDPKGFLAQYPHGAILDEVQRAPELLSWLQGIVDATGRVGEWIVTGSQNFLLGEAVTQSLAGRLAWFELYPPSLGELRRFPGAGVDLDATLFAGAYPRIHDQGIPPGDWLANYVTTYVERDVRELLNVGDLLQFQDFLRLCAGRSGQLLNLSSLGADVGISQPTAKAWLSLLETSYLLFRLRPFHRKLRKRLVKMPKLYFHDTGLLCWLLGIRSQAELRAHPLRGAIFETFVVSEVVKAHAHRGEKARLSFYRDQAGSEVDLLVERGVDTLAVEIKAGRTVAPDFFDAFDRLDQALATGAEPPPRIERLVVHGGDVAQPWPSARVVPWRELDGIEWTRATV